MAMTSREKRRHGLGIQLNPVILEGELVKYDTAEYERSYGIELAPPEQE